MLAAGRVTYAPDDIIQARALAFVGIEVIVAQIHARAHHGSRSKEQEGPQTTRMRFADLAQTRVHVEKDFYRGTPAIEGQSS